MSTDKLLGKIEEIKQKLTDQEYKEILEEMQEKHVRTKKSYFNCTVMYPHLLLVKGEEHDEEDDSECNNSHVHVDFRKIELIAYNTEKKIKEMLFEPSAIGDIFERLGVGELYKHVINPFVLDDKVDMVFYEAVLIKYEKR